MSLDLLNATAGTHLKILVITLCRNEARMIPWFLRHYSFANEIHIWDNNSSDGGPDIIANAKMPPRVRLFPYDTGGVLRDDLHAFIKSYHYRLYAGFDWIICVDMDEFIYHPDIRSYLALCDAANVPIPWTLGFDMVGEGFPTFDPQSSAGLPDLVKTGVVNHDYCKRALFKPTVNMVYGAGCHPLKHAEDGDHGELKLLHFRHWSEDDSAQRAARIVLSDQNKENGWGLTGVKETDPDAQRNRYRNLRERRQVVI